MGIVDKVLWYVETFLDGPVTLDEMAAALGVTPFHLTRSFAMLTGQGAMRYLWRRRLTRAAQALIAPGPSILTLALDSGYASAEAFSRAFRAEFGLSPSALRRLGHLDGLTLTHPMEYQPAMTPTLAPPRIETARPMVFAGPVLRYDMTTRARIPGQWAAYNQAEVRVPSPAPYDYYGVAFNFDMASGQFDYLCGQEVALGTPLPEGWGHASLTGGPYARFSSKGHISTMQAAMAEIYTHWLSLPAYRPRPGPTVEYYPPEFDGMSGDGGYEIWVTIEG